MNIHIEAGGFQFLAKTNPEAPITVAAFLKLLPYRQKLIHVRWSGEGCWVPLGDFVLEQDGKAIGFENATRHPAPGAILFYPGGYSETELSGVRRLLLCTQARSTGWKSFSDNH